jgi:hypothetical protein
MSAERAAFHLARAKRLVDALTEQAALETLLPPRKSATLVTSLRVLKDKIELAGPAQCRRGRYGVRRDRHREVLLASDPGLAGRDGPGAPHHRPGALAHAVERGAQVPTTPYSGRLLSGRPFLYRRLLSLRSDGALNLTARGR